MSATMIIIGLLAWSAVSIGSGIFSAIMHSRAKRRIRDIDESQLEGDLQNAVRDINFGGRS